MPLPPNPVPPMITVQNSYNSYLQNQAPSPLSCPETDPTPVTAPSSAGEDADMATILEMDQFLQEVDLDSSDDDRWTQVASV